MSDSVKVDVSAAAIKHRSAIVGSYCHGKQLKIVLRLLSMGLERSNS